jgi:hypothetical protein
MRSRSAGYVTPSFPLAAKPSAGKTAGLGKTTLFSNTTVSPIHFPALPTVPFPLTLLVEFNFTTLPGAGTLVSFGGSGTAAGGFAVWSTSGGALTFTLGGVNDYALGITVAALTDYTLLLTFDGSNVQATLRNKVDRSITYGAPIAASGMLAASKPLTIGATYDGGLANYFDSPDGHIGSVAMWDRVLSPKAILSLLGNPYQIWGMPNGLVSITAQAGRTATLQKTLGALTLSAAGTVSTPGGNLNATLGALTTSATGSVAVAATLAKTLGALTLSATSGSPRNATLTKTLGALTVAGAGTVRDPVNTAGMTADGSNIPLWLSDPAAIRCALIEVGALSGGVETTRYLSTVGYVTGPSETPANTAYLPIVVAAGSIQFTEQLGLDGSGGMSFGDIELYNVGGERDSWLADIWANRSVKVWIGDPRWPRADFIQVFTGVLSNPGLVSRRRDRLNLQLRDKMQRLNKPISEIKLGGTTANAEKLIPLTFGDCHNVSPLLIDPANETFQVHNGQVEAIEEVRDNGVPIAFTPNLTFGTFTLPHKPFGAVTASVQGDIDTGVYHNTPAQLIQRLAVSFGSLTERFTAQDVDSDQFAAFDAAHNVPVGVYLDDRANVLEVIQSLAASVGAQVVCSRDGKMQIKQVTLPVTSSMGTPVAIDAADMLENTLSVVDRPVVQAAVKLAYCKNWTLQPGLQTAIPDEHKALYAEEWLTTTASSDNAFDQYKLTFEPVQQESLLVSKTAADAEAQRRLNCWQVQRTVYGFSGKPNLFNLTLGQPVTLTHWRFGLDAGKTGIVTALTLDWLAATIKVEVLV